MSESVEQHNTSIFREGISQKYNILLGTAFTGGYDRWMGENGIDYKACHETIIFLVHETGI